MTASTSRLDWCISIFSKGFTLASTFGVLALLPGQAAGAQEIAQGIAPLPAGGTYGGATLSAPGILGQAIQEASAASSKQAAVNVGKKGAVALRGSLSPAGAASPAKAALPALQNSPRNLPGINSESDTDEDSQKIAQAANQSVSQTSSNSTVDLAPVKLLERTTPVFHANQFQTRLLYKLPARLFFYSTTENSLRLETNVLQTLHRNRADMIYRVLPNVTIGYALTKTTRVSANYFFLRDQYTRDNHALSRNIHSIGVQIQHDIPLTEKTNVTAGLMGRQLLLSRGQPLSDLLPSVQVTHRVGSKGVIYGGLLGQIRFRNTLGLFQEGDQFYSLGGMYRTARWFFLWDNTLVTNFGNRRLRFGPNNQNIIMTMEADYRIHPRLPLVAFVRAQPIFNMGADEAIGFAGVNFRIFGGLRIDLNKSPIFPVQLDKKRKR